MGVKDLRFLLSSFKKGFLCKAVHRIAALCFRWDRRIRSALFLPANPERSLPVLLTQKTHLKGLLLTPLSADLFFII